MQNNVFRKSLVVVIIILFVGASVIPSMGNSIVIIDDLQGNKITFKVTKSGGYIQGLIDNASDGDTIFIPNGTYYENIIINKSISLIGEDKDTTIIDRFGYWPPIVHISSDNVTISGFTIRNSSIFGEGFSGAIVIEANNTKIKDNIICDNHGFLWADNFGIILLGSSNLIINNTIINNSNGIGAYYVCNNIIINNNISSNRYAINLIGNDIIPCEYNLISDNYLSGSFSNGICLYKSNHNDIINNSITLNNENGIYLHESSSNTITDNNIGSNYNDGICLEDSNSNNIITDNTIINNGAGIRLYGGFGNNITGNTISSNNDDGIYLEWSSGNNITDNNISNNDFGICLWFSSGNIITGNTMMDDAIIIEGDLLEHWNTHVIDTSNTVNSKPVVYWKDQIGGTIPAGAGQVILANCTNVLVENQNIDGGDVGIELGFSSGCNITGNTIISNDWSGICLFDSSSNNIIGNTISNNGDGIFLWLSSSNTISSNTISNNNEHGINLYQSISSNTITGNTISNNYYGITISSWAYSENNIFYHNNFINNEQNAYDPHSNTWYNAELQEGNYWSDYTGIDFNSDGIGDIPYDIPGGRNKDLYPFMESDGWLKEPEFCKAFIVGKITNLIAAGKYITFEAVKTRVITFKPFSFHKYVSGEKLILSKDYLGLIGVRYVFALCEITIKI